MIKKSNEIFKFIKNRRFLILMMICIMACSVGFNYLMRQQEQILRRYFITTPQEKLKELHESLSNSLSSYFVRENKSADLKQVEDYIKRYGKTSLYDLLFIFRDKDGSLKQLSKSGLANVSSDILSQENIYPVAIDNGNIDGYLMVIVSGRDSAEIKEGLIKYKLTGGSLKLIFLLLVTALAVIIIYHEYSAKMKIAKDLAEIKASNDGLTGLHTHEYFMKSLDIEARKVQVYNTPLALLMMDIDHFKRFNDTYGHPAGDKVLQDVSQIINLSTRATDILTRYGGEEFSVIIPYVLKPGDLQDDKRLDNFLNEVKVVAERIRKNVEDHETEYNSQILKVTVSIGIAFYEKGLPDISAKTLLEKSDSALYQAKRLGRNRVFMDNGPSREGG